VVFNNQRLLANLQKQDPRVIQYNFDNPVRWHDFGTQNIREIFQYSDPLNPFYEPRTVSAAVLNEHTVRRVTQSLTNRLKEAVSNHRSYRMRQDTKWLERFYTPVSGTNANSKVGTVKYEIQKRLAYEEKLGETTLCSELAKNDPEYLDSVNDIHRKKQKWLDNVRSNLPGKNWMYTEMMLHFKHSDPNRISDAVIHALTGRNSCMLTLTDEQSPTFGLGVHLETLPARVTPVRVFICAIYKKVRRVQ
jgi:hypothetical protein